MRPATPGVPWLNASHWPSHPRLGSDKVRATRRDSYEAGFILQHQLKHWFPNGGRYWRAVEKPRQGEIHGIPTLRGQLILVSDGLAVMQTTDGRYVLVHESNFRADLRIAGFSRSEEPKETVEETLPTNNKRKSPVGLQQSLHDRFAHLIND